MKARQKRHVSVMTIDLAEKHRNRRAKIDYQQRIATICAQGGIQARHYHHNLHPFCFNVKMPWHFPFKEIFDRMVKEHWLSPAEAIIAIGDMQSFEKVWNDSSEEYQCALDDLQRSFFDDDWARMLRPHLERKYHVKCPDKGFDVKWETEGRSGGWLVLARFEGITFRAITCSPDHLYMDIEDPDGENWYRRKLCAYLEEGCLMLSEDARRSEMVYRLAWQMNQRVEQWASR